MSVVIVKDTTVEIHKYSRTLRLVNTEPALLERRYSNGGKEFLPDLARAEWKHGENIEEIALSGPVLKKDGTPGVNRTMYRYITPSNRWWGKGKDFAGREAPVWLLELFEIEVPA